VNEHRVTGAMIGSLLFFALVPVTIAGLIPFWLTGWRVAGPFLEAPVLPVTGVFMIVAGLGSLLESFARFVLVGHGTPAPVAPPTCLVVSGQYRHVRNPMYVAILVIVVGQGLVLGSVALLYYTGLLWFFFYVWVIIYEEPALGSQFGVSYRVYRENVRRWWPRLRPWDA